MHLWTLPRFSQTENKLISKTFTEYMELWEPCSLLITFWLFSKKLFFSPVSYKTGWVVVLCFYFIFFSKQSAHEGHASLLLHPPPRRTAPATERGSSAAPPPPPSLTLRAAILLYGSDGGAGRNGGELRPAFSRVTSRGGWIWKRGRRRRRR